MSVVAQLPPDLGGASGKVRPPDLSTFDDLLRDSILGSIH